MAANSAVTFDGLDIVSATGTQRLKAFSQSAKLLGKGGAGSVYAHPDLPGQAIKIYGTANRADAHAKKVQAMLNATPRAVRTRFGTVQIAWPNATVLIDRRFAGFVMPQVNFSEAWTLQQVAQPPQRKRRGIPERMDLRLYAGRNLASVLHSLHEFGHYVIDLKPQNVLVYRDDTQRNAAHVALVDCDGFQIRASTGYRFDAELATPEFLHPDVTRQVGDEASFDLRLLNDKAALQDDFALAVILFQLLNNGLHPMSGRESGIAAVPTQWAMRLQAGGRYYAYKQGQSNPLMFPDLDSLHEWFDPELRKLFDQAFGGGEPPPHADDWVRVLERLSTATQTCDQNPEHWKLGSMCGQCVQANRMQAAGTPMLSQQVQLPPRSLVRPIPSPVQRPKPTRRRSVMRRNLVILAVGGIAVARFLHNSSPPAVGLTPSEHPSSVAGDFRDNPQATLSYVAPKVFPTQDRAVSFATSYFKYWSGNDGVSLAFDDQTYALQVNYYGKLTSNSAVLASKRSFIGRWPKRSYLVRPASLTATCQATMCNVSGIVDWDVQSETRNARTTGTAQFALDVDFGGDVALIVGENGNVLNRSR